MAATQEISELGISFLSDANELETSLLLSTSRADLVELAGAVANLAPDLPDAERQVWSRRLGFTLQFGNYGNPKKSNKKIGEKVIQATVEKGVVLIEALKGNVKKGR